MDVISPDDAERFRAPEHWLDRADARTAAALVAAAADVALVIDRKGVVRDVSVGSPELKREHCGEWIGRPWADLVTVESRGKVEALLQDAVIDSKTIWREINHLGAADRPIPISYTVMRLGPEGDVLAIGRDLRLISDLQQRVVDIQRSMERDYARLRNAETRYRLLFQLASEAVLIVDGSTGRITEANPIAAELIDQPTNRLVGRPLRDLFEPGFANQVASLAISARTVGRTDPIVLRTADQRQELSVSASLFRQDSLHYLLVRLEPVDAGNRMRRRSAHRAYEILQNFPEAFVAVDAEGRILEANISFCEAAELASPEMAIGEPLERWLGRPGVDVQLLLGNLKEHHTIREFATILRGELGRVEETELTAVLVPDQRAAVIGIVLRQARRRPVATRREDLGPSVEHLTQLVGSVPMKDLVRETTDLIEQMCIQAALKLTDDNRASAAQILGLSRQSLYAKLRRFGIVDFDDSDEA